MDEKSPCVNIGDILPESDQVYRHVLVSQRDKRNNNIPSVSCFSLSPNDGNKLSVDWAHLTTPEECVARIGASYRMGHEEYKPYQNREVYALDISFLNSLPDIECVVYDPIKFSSKEKGKVDNPSHSLIVFFEGFVNKKIKEPETILKMRDHAANKKAILNRLKIEELIELYRS